MNNKRSNDTTKTTSSPSRVRAKLTLTANPAKATDESLKNRIQTSEWFPAGITMSLGKVNPHKSDPICSSEEK